MSVMLCENKTTNNTHIVCNRRNVAMRKTILIRDDEIFFLLGVFLDIQPKTNVMAIITYVFIHLHLYSFVCFVVVGILKSFAYSFLSWNINNSKKK